jgi:metal-responsive CopG/Arc/MetJ family transcriptional regulator
MTDVVPTRLDEKEIEELNQISEKERIDRSSLIRKFLLAQIEEYRLKDSFKLGFDITSTFVMKISSK